MSDVLEGALIGFIVVIVIALADIRSAIEDGCIAQHQEAQQDE